MMPVIAVSPTTPTTAIYATVVFSLQKVFAGGPAGFGEGVGIHPQSGEQYLDEIRGRRIGYMGER